MLLPITALYAGLCMIIATALGFHVGPYRGKSGISILHGEDMELALRSRRHANFTEHVPLALILMAIVEANGASLLILHGAGITLVLARIAHPIGLKLDNIAHPLRAIGAAGTMLATVTLGAAALWQAYQALL